MFLKGCLLLVVAVTVQSSALNRQKRSLITLQATVTAAIDIEARRELLFLIVGKINDTVKAQTEQIDDCEKKINDTVDACNTCQANKCGAPVPIHQAALNTISAGLNYPVVYAGKGVEEIGKWFSGSTTFMGNRAIDFSNAVGSTANTVGNSLEQAGNEALSFLGNGFSNLGNGFISTGETLAEAAKKTGAGVLGLGQGISNLDGVIGGALNDFQSGFNSFVSNIGSSISNTASDFWDSTFGKLGRKKRSVVNLRHKRCTNSCPMCDDLDTDKYTVDQITNKVCGAGSVQSRQDAVSDITFLRELYNKTVTDVLVSEIEFETGSIDFSNGTPAFSVSFYVISGVKTQLNGIFDSSRQVETGKAIAEQYFTELLAKRT